MSRRIELVSIVVPTYNERESLPRLVEGIREHLRRPYEVVVVDDASPDGTAEAAKALAAEHPIRVIEREGKLGLGSAYRAGFRAARGDAILEMDADLSHDPRYIPALLEAVQRGAGVAIGSRYVGAGKINGWGAYRHLVSVGGNTLARLSLGLPVRDATSGFRCYARECADLVLRTRADGYAFQVEVLFAAKSLGVPVVEVPIVFENRRNGKSKLGASEFTRFLSCLARLRFRGLSPPKDGAEDAVDAPRIQ